MYQRENHGDGQDDRIVVEARKPARVPAGYSQEAAMSGQASSPAGNAGAAYRASLVAALSAGDKKPATTYDPLEAAPSPWGQPDARNQRTGDP
eukprot:1582951-Heterocapsa_arctica.AAC.1